MSCARPNAMATIDGGALIRNLAGVVVGVGLLIAAASAPAALVPGDIAFVECNADNPDSFEFVALVDIPVGEVIRFTDNGWTAAGAFRATEGVLQWTPPAGGVAAGTVVEVDGTWTTSTGTIAVANGTFALSVAGDQILAYQGTDASPSFLYAINVQDNSVWQADSTTSNESALPTGLINGSTAVAVDEEDNVKYDGTVLSGSRGDILAGIGNASNWDGSDSVRQEFANQFAPPTLAVLTSFDAIVRDGAVIVVWTTSSEYATAAFVVERADGDQWVAVGAEPVPAAGAAQGGIGAVYEVDDPGASPGGEIVYRLIEIEVDGTEIAHGPFTREARAVQVALPVRATADGIELRWLSRDGETYRIVRSTPHAEGGEAIATMIPATPPENLYVDPAAGVARATYRIEVDR